MRSIIKKIIMTSSILVGLMGLSLYAAPALMAAPPTSVPNTPKAQICQGVGAVTGGTDCSQPAGGASVDSILRLALNILSLVVGIIAVIMVIVGGLKYILSQGESAQTASAKNTILYAVIGMVVALLAQVIVKFVLNKAAV